ncbi:MAG: phosphotransferase [Bacteroidales bacterium]|nr:phosphotransferase [Bacteroidales bacterium]
MEKELSRLYLSFAGKNPERITPLPQSGSNRKYFRLTGGCGSIIGVKGERKEENRTFCAFAKHFLAKGINVPEVYALSEDGLCYIQQDLGEESLFERLSGARASGNYSKNDIVLLKDTIRQLVKCQIVGDKGLNYGQCFEEEQLSKRGIIFDLHYFKYCFLKASGVAYNEYRLENDFELLAADLLKASPNGFLYRDFQARNVMLFHNKPYLIDFQGGKKGPVHYDLASFVYQAKSNYPQSIKRILIDTYKEEYHAITGEKLPENFDQTLQLFVFFRTLQVLAAYGFRGNFERKAHFLESIPFAIANLEKCLPICEKYPYLKEVLNALVAKYNCPKTAEEGLTIEISSFSYKKGIPADNSGNGGGYVFDCRGHNNPGRYEEYKRLTGLDEPVKEFLRTRSGIDGWLCEIYKIIDPHIEVFLSRDFHHLQVSFGCTGGHHRSVYSAEALAAHIKEKYPQVRIVISHPESGVAPHEYE